MPAGQDDSHLEVSDGESAVSESELERKGSQKRVLRMQSFRPVAKKRPGSGSSGVSRSQSISSSAELQRRSSSRRSGTAFSYAESGLQPPSLEEMHEILHCGSPGTGGNAAAKQWINDYLEVCTKHPVTLPDPADKKASLRDWNADFLQIAEMAQTDDDYQERGERLGDLLEEMKTVVSPIVEQLVLSLHSETPDHQPLRPVAIAPNGFPKATFHVDNLVFHFSSEPRLPSRVVRNCTAVNNAHVPNLVAPLASQFLYAGHRVLVVAKIPLTKHRKPMWPNEKNESPVCLALLEQLTEALNVERLAANNAEMHYGMDARTYLVPSDDLMPPSSPESKGGVRGAIRPEMGVSNFSRVLTTESAPKQEEVALDKIVANVVDEKIEDIRDPQNIIEAIRTLGLSVRTLPRLVTHPDLGELTDKVRADFRASLVVEMVARTVRHLGISECTRLCAKKKHTDDECMQAVILHTNRLFQHVLTDQAAWAEWVAPLAAKKFNTNEEIFTWGQYIDREHRQALLRRLCELLGTATSNQRVSDLVTVMPCATDATADPNANKLVARGASFYGATPDKVLKTYRTSIKKECGEREPYSLAMLGEFYESQVEDEDDEDDDDDAPKRKKKSPNQLLSDKATAAYTEMVKLRKAAYNAKKTPVNAMMYSYALERLAMWFSLRRMIDECLETIDEAIEIRKEVLEDLPREQLELSRLLQKKVEAQVRASEYEAFDDIQPDLEEILQSLDTGVENGWIDMKHAFTVYVPVLQHLSKGHQAVEEWEDAEKYALRMAKLCEEVKGDLDEDLAIAVTELANIYMALGRFHEAGTRFQEAVDVYIKVYGVEHPSTATAMNNLACLYYNQAHKARNKKGGNLLRPRLGKEATEYFLKAKGLLEKVVGLPKEVLEQMSDQDQDRGGAGSLLADALNNLASVNLLMGDYGEAERLYERSLAISLSLFDEDHPDVVNAKKNLNIMRARRNVRSALFIQTLWRGWVVRHRMRQRLIIEERRKKAIHILHQVFLTFVSRQVVHQKQIEVLERKRLELEREKAATEHAAATKIQAIVRMWIVKRRVVIIRQEREAQRIATRNDAAVKIQKVVRGHMGRKKAAAQLVINDTIHRERIARLRLQRVGRGLMTRLQLLKVHQKREEEEEEERHKEAERRKQDEAATKIQATVRGYQARKHVAEIRHELEVQVVRRTIAATKIQAFVRMIIAKKRIVIIREERRVEMVVRINAAVTIQKIIRRFLAKKYVEQRREEARIVLHKRIQLVTLLQAVGRASKNRTLCYKMKVEEEERRRREEEERVQAQRENEDSAATKIQALHRGRKGREEADRLRQEKREKEEAEKKAAEEAERKAAEEKEKEEAEKKAAEEKEREEAEKKAAEEKEREEAEKKAAEE
eukprot:Sspe_Gene.61000::Locus_33730_Transcript_1_1_Confidence_1.000_Length_4203::g.61000::m.61000